MTVKGTEAIDEEYVSLMVPRFKGGTTRKWLQSVSRFNGVKTLKRGEDAALNLSLILKWSEDAALTSSLRAFLTVDRIHKKLDLMIGH